MSHFAQRGNRSSFRRSLMGQAVGRMDDPVNARFRHNVSRLKTPYPRRHIAGRFYQKWAAGFTAHLRSDARMRNRAAWGLDFECQSRTECNSYLLPISQMPPEKPNPKLFVHSHPGTTRELVACYCMACQKFIAASTKLKWLQIAETAHHCQGATHVGIKKPSQGLKRSNGGTKVDRG